MKRSLFFILLLNIALNICPPIQGAKILSVFGYPGPSQYFFITPLLKALAERGHEVVSVSVFPQKEPLKNFRDIPVMTNAHIFDEMTVTFAEGEKKSFIEEFLNLARAGQEMVSNVFENPEVQKMMANEGFDLIIMDILTSEALVGLGEHFHAPMVAVSTFGSAGFMDEMVGNPSPLSYIPHMALPFGNHMTLWERLVNVAMETVDKLSFHLLMLPHQDQVYKKYFPNAKMSLNEARQNVSLVLLNDHFSLRAPRPYVPNMIEVGGMHIKRQADPLPQDLQQILDESPEGVVYFSLGSNVKSKDLNKDLLNAFLEAFREVKLKVLWKFENDELPNKPENVIIRKWFPQPSVLAHPNVKLFISHGGFLSTTETIYHGKPILGIPFLGDQFMNVKNAVKAGYALSLKLEDVTKDSLKSAIMELWTNPRYAQAVQQKSKYFRDTPLTPLETAVYWMEYVIRHKGCPHMRNAGQDLNFIQYHNIDVFAIVASAMVLLVTLLVAILRKLKQLLFGNSKRKGNAKNSKKSKLN
ncbi:UDP-glucosyltransferase 2-like [Stomoxys calcitrans]|uniref:UDP-glucosyltransferase 2-like n=1 Tax=Stomoxys calcitrans TaxID=35570 RepID=UPI0027E2D9F1|nr:UDP-glucosyltransferase 2-like [Stomoxys calcitrans]